MKLMDMTVLAASAAMAAALASIFLFDVSGVDAATVRLDSIVAASALGLLILSVWYRPPDADANKFRAVTIRRETVLTREVFLNIVSDLRKLDDGKRRRAQTFAFTIH
jgi:hypothetical protein